MNAPRNYWFPAKRYGWGWGVPSTWQGWIVLLLYAAALLVLAVVCPPAVNPLAFSGWMIGLSVVLVIVCWITGEPPRWHWGK